jgi:hypothetical protein
MQSILATNHHYEKSSHSFSFAGNSDFYLLLCKRDIQAIAPRPGKKSGWNSIGKALRSGSAEALIEPRFLRLVRIVWILLTFISF